MAFSKPRHRLSLYKVIHKIEQGAFSSWKALNCLELKYKTNLLSRSNEVFRNLYGLHVERLYIEGGLSGLIRFHGFQASNLKALAIGKTEVNLFDFSIFNMNTLQWLDVSCNRLDKFEIPFVPQLYHLNISDQRLSVECLSGMKYFPGSLTSIDFSGTPLCYPPITCVLQAKFVNLRNTELRFLIGKDALCQRSHKVAKISHLGLQENRLQSVNSTLFTQYDWSALNVLRLSDNILALDGNGIWDNIQTTLKNLWNLTDLYLHGNFVENNLSPDMLVNQTKLQSLYLSHMALTNLTLKMHHMMNLNFLDLSYNKIQCFYTSTMRDINEIIGYTPGGGKVSKVLEINLSYNPLRCSCSSLEFYQWMRRVRPYITFTDFSAYQCTFHNGHKVTLLNLNLIVDILRSLMLINRLVSSEKDNNCNYNRLHTYFHCRNLIQIKTHPEEHVVET